jgi:hypothetical protein
MTPCPQEKTMAFDVDLPTPEQALDALLLISAHLEKEDARLSLSAARLRSDARALQAAIAALTGEAGTARTLPCQGEGREGFEKVPSAQTPNSLGSSPQGENAPC